MSGLAPAPSVAAKAAPQAEEDARSPKRARARAASKPGAAASPRAAPAAAAAPRAAWFEALKAQTEAALQESGRCKLVFALGAPELSKADDDDPCCGVCFEVTKDGVHLGEVMLGSKVEPEVLVGERFWVAPFNWYAPGPDLDASYLVRTEQPAVLDDEGEYSGQDTKRWALMYGTKSWANNFCTLRGRWDAAREAKRTLEDLWAWADEAAGFEYPKTQVPAATKVTVKRYALDDSEFEDALEAEVIYDATADA